MIPKINLIYFKNIIDNSITRFINDASSFFIKENDRYILSKKISRKKLTSYIEEYIKTEISSLATEYDITQPNYYFVIGSCFPCDNMLLDYETDIHKIPTKIKKVIEEHPNIKYVLKEKDVIIDIKTINYIFEEIFSKFFEQKNILKKFGKKYKNLFFIKHEKIDCYSMYRIIKDIYGRANTINLHKKNKEKMAENIVSINELIGKSIQKKKEICRNETNSYIRNEIKQYVESCILGNSII